MSELSILEKNCPFLCECGLVLTKILIDPRTTCIKNIYLCDYDSKHPHVICSHCGTNTGCNSFVCRTHKKRANKIDVFLSNILQYGSIKLQSSSMGGLMITDVPYNQYKEWLFSQYATSSNKAVHVLMKHSPIEIDKSYTIGQCIECYTGAAGMVKSISIADSIFPINTMGPHMEYITSKANNLILKIAVFWKTLKINCIPLFYGPSHHCEQPFTIELLVENFVIASQKLCITPTTLIGFTLTPICCNTYVSGPIQTNISVYGRIRLHNDVE